MAKRVKEEEKTVRCRDCEREIRDVDGMSRSMVTGEYFMCRCAKGHDRNRWDQLSKLFINELRKCQDYRPKKI